jgi:dsDNA-binding SOS-regulon protein
MKVAYVVTLDDGTKIEVESKKDIKAVARTREIANKLVAAALESDPSLEDSSEAVLVICEALAKNRKAVTSAYIIPRPGRSKG